VEIQVIAPAAAHIFWFSEYAAARSIGCERQLRHLRMVGYVDYPFPTKAALSLSRGERRRRGLSYHKVAFLLLDSWERLCDREILDFRAVLRVAYAQA